MELEQSFCLKRSAARLDGPFGKILVRFDRSLESYDALEVARKLALHWKAKLYVVGCDPLPDDPSDEAFYDAVTGALRHYREFFFRIRLSGMNDGLQAETFICPGTPAGVLLRKAQQLKARLLVVGSTGDLDVGSDALPCDRRLVILCSSELRRRKFE